MPRLIQPARRYATDGVTTRTSTPRESIEDFLERIAKYVPVEILSIYLVVNAAAAKASPRLPALIEVAMYVALVALTPIYLWKLGGDVPDKPRQIAVATTSFVIWTYGIGGSFFWARLAELVHHVIVYPLLATFLVAVWAVVSGLIAPRPA